MTIQPRMPRVSERLSERNRQALEAMLKAEEEAEQKCAQLELDGPTAWDRLAAVARGNSGQSHHCRRILLSLYNGGAWPLDPTCLRVIDRELQADALTVIEWSIYSLEEPHDYVMGGSQFMQRFAAIETGEEE